MLVECDGSLCFPVALFLAFKKIRGTVTTHAKNWRITSVVTKQKMNFVVVERIK